MARGAFAGPESIHQLGPERGVLLGLAEQRLIDADGFYAALAQPGVDMPSDVRVTLNDARHGLGPWRALHEPAIAGLSAIGAATNREMVPVLIEYPGRVGTATVALVVSGALAALVRLGEEQPFELGARPLGQEGHRLAQRLIRHIHDWNARRRPWSSPLLTSDEWILVPSLSAGLVNGKTPTRKYRTKPPELSANVYVRTCGDTTAF